MRDSDTPLTDAQRAFAGSPAVQRIARYWAGRYAAARPRLTHELLSAAMLGAVRAARQFDPDRLPRGWQTVVVCRVRWAMADAVRADRPTAYGRRRADAPDVGRMDHDPASGELPVGWELECEDAVRGLCAGLPGREGEAVALYHLHPWRFEDVARRMGVTKVWAWKLYRAGVGRLRAAGRAA